MRHLALLSLAALLSSCLSPGREDPPVVNAPPGNRWGSSDYYGGGTPSPEPGLFEEELHGASTVAPDRALVSLEMTVEATSRAAALEQVRAKADALRARGEGEGCSTSIWSFGPIQGHGEEHTASATLRLDVDLRGLTSPADRHTRIEACLAPLYDLPADTFEGVHLRIGEPRVTIDDPSAHRARLLERRFEALRAVEAMAGAPAQFRATGLRCTSSGQVSITHRSLSGVRLAVDFACSPAPLVEAEPRDDYEGASEPL
jgi:hypothetical protein